MTDLEHLSGELNNSLPLKKETESKRDSNIRYFPDEHFRLGFEDFPVSYSVIFDEFLFSKDTRALIYDGVHHSAFPLSTPSPTLSTIGVEDQLDFISIYIGYHSASLTNRHELTVAVDDITP
jgi:hypothetical protein